MLLWAHKRYFKDHSNLVRIKRTVALLGIWTAIIVRIVTKSVLFHLLPVSRDAIFVRTHYAILWVFFLDAEERNAPVSILPQVCAVAHLFQAVWDSAAASSKMLHGADLRLLQSKTITNLTLKCTVFMIVPNWKVVILWFFNTSLTNLLRLFVDKIYLIFFHKHFLIDDVFS